jgi:long-chain acyl-CoA synthetase
VSNLASLLSDTVRAHPARPALLAGERRIAYRELGEARERCTGLLRGRGIQPGDRVAVLLPNGLDFIAALYGALAAGAIAVPLNPLLRGAEVAERLADSGAALVVAPSGAEQLAGLDVARADPAEAGSARLAADVCERDAGEPAVLLYTSGTTGRPKGAELTHGGLRATTAFLAGPLLQLSADDVVLGAAPFSHIFGLAGVLNPAVATGACIALLPRFDADAALALMLRESAEVFLGVPSMCIALLRAAEAGAAVPKLRVAHVGGAPLSPETLHAFAGRFGCEVLEGYGMTETAGGCVSHVSGQRCKPGSVGTPAPGAELRIVLADGADAGPREPGEVLLRAPGLMRGYWGNPSATSEAFAAGGWFRTGDVGYLDGDGYLYLIDRTKDVILRGGYSVYPREVEDALYEHPAISEVAVIGVPDELLGEEVVALVVPRSGEECDPAAIRAFARERVAAYKYPRLVVVADELPRTASGKILKRAIDRAPLRTALDEELAKH